MADNGNNNNNNGGGNKGGNSKEGITLSQSFSSANGGLHQAVSGAVVNCVGFILASIVGMFIKPVIDRGISAIGDVFHKQQNDTPSQSAPAIAVPQAEHPMAMANRLSKEDPALALKVAALIERNIDKSTTPTAEVKAEHTS